MGPSSWFRAGFLWLLWACSGWADLASSVGTPRSEADLLEIQERVQRLLPRAKEATVVVLGEGSGSGVIVSRGGLVLTAGHVCGTKGSALRVLLPNGNLAKAISLGSENGSDAGLAQLQPGRYPFSPLLRTDKDALPLGTWCVALGHPGGYDGERGPIVRLGRVISVGKDTLRSDCKLVGGDSGGPLFDLEGRVIGIHSRISRAADQNFHVPISVFRQEWKGVIP